MTATLILTHENADFDAVAAQLAVAKLHPSAIPVLSRHVNRNVQSFLTLYGDALPFVRAGELTRRRVKQAIVVDTQTYPTVRGMHPDTPVQIIDHHPLVRELEPHQQYAGEPLGATTTLLVEQLRDAPVSLAPIEATLLMLGIYEDTGSLLYGTTTPRDLVAAAWLLDQGANLDLVRSFLTHPLTEDQQALYARLVEGVQTYEIGGHVILVAAARSDHDVEEVATLAHKIRDSYDANAVILLVGMNDHVQLVARSTVDDIDVAQLAEQFGGGGHGRAAAASIRDESFERIQERLIEILPRIVRPSVRVEDLMSWGVKTLPADEKVSAAAAQMQRSGHEGYPVVSDGKIVGLLMRSAVDRAMSHGLAHKRVDQLMSKGIWTVQPSDSIETVQQVMMQSGWGQLPVVNGDGKVLGIVTRTDLLKHWSQPKSAAADERIVQRMHTWLPAGLVKLLNVIADEAQAHEMSLYAVGGFVRDLLLGMVNLDIDLVTEGNAITLAQALKARYGGTVKAHPKFGTAKWLLDEQVAQRLGASLADWPPFIDFVAARREFYTEPAALPTVEQGSIKLDLLRRDFTINTLAIRLAPAPFGKLLDFYGGERDLQQKVIRVLHSLSFIDDATRMLRAVRFEQRLGFRIEPHTEALFADALPYLHDVSGERLRHELDLILAEAQPEHALCRLQRLGVLAHINGRLIFDEWLSSAFKAARAQLAYPGWNHGQAHLTEVYWAILACRLENPEELASRLQMKRTRAALIERLKQVYVTMPYLSERRLPSEVVYHLDGLPETLLVAAWAIAPTALAREHVTQYARNWRHIHATLTGDDLRRMGLKPGPSFGKLLGRLRQAWLDGEVNSPEQEMAYLKRMIAEGSTHDGD
jgi:tRNA nucleotidyltransferase (CCA-adding enzyme)